MSHSTMGIVIVVISKGGHNTADPPSEKRGTGPSSSVAASDQNSPPDPTTTQPSKSNSPSRSSTGYTSTTTPSEISREWYMIPNKTNGRKIEVPTNKSTETKTVKGNLVLLWFLCKGKVVRLSACIFGVRLQNTFPANNCPSDHYFSWGICWGYWCLEAELLAKLFWSSCTGRSCRCNGEVVGLSGFRSGARKFVIKRVDKGSFTTVFVTLTLESPDTCFQKSRNFSGPFRLPQIPLYLRNAEVLSHQTSQSSYTKNMFKAQFFKTRRLQFDKWLLGPKTLSGISRNRP